MFTLSNTWEWLGTPLSGASMHLIEPHVYWHARLMVMAWGICLPLGALVARYFKVMPRQDWPRELDSKAWWHSHRTLQYTGLLAMSAGLYLVWPNGTTWNLAWNVSSAHQTMGWCVLILGWMQMFSGILRGSKGGPTDHHMAGDHYDMTLWRVVFERVHKSLGWLAIGLALIVIVLGLLAADAPRWMLVALLVWWSVLSSIALQLQRRGCCIDTYQAIWGLYHNMPGLKRPPIGWGVHRNVEHPWRSTSTPFDNH